MSSDVLRLVLGTTLAASIAILLLQLLRAPLRRWLGTGAAYAAWACVPVAVIAALLPARDAPVEWGAMGVVLQPMRAATAVVSSVQVPMWEMLLLAIWLGGVAAMAIALWIQQRRFVRGLGELHRREDGLWIAGTSQDLPAAIGLFRIRIVVPSDFDSRYDARERRLIACHERLHVSRGDLAANALVSALRCVYWFNPVIPLATRRFRFDQELACDADVIRRHPGARRAYGEAMLKAQLQGMSIPVACHWPAPHPLRERIGMLGRKLPSARRRALASLLVTAMIALVGYGAWAAQPAQSPATSQAVPFRVAMSVDVGGAGSTFEIRERPGKAFAVSGPTGDGGNWKGVFRIEAMDGGHARLFADIDVAGQSSGASGLVIELDKPAEIRIGGEGGTPPLALGLTVTREPETASAFTHDAGSANGPDRRIDRSKLAPPRYPASRHEGTVVMRLEVGRDGRVTRIGLDRSSGFEDLDQAAMTAARGWYIEPAIEGGRAVASTVRVPVEFSLDEPHTIARQDARASEGNMRDNPRTERR